MLDIRLIPSLLLKGRRFVQTRRFQGATYLGDPINIVRIFNEKQVDELAILDITASLEGRAPMFNYIEQLAEECFMPLSYGGGVKSIDDFKRLIKLGVEKVILNSCMSSAPELVSEAADQLGSQSVVVSIDVKRNWLGKYTTWTHSGTGKLGTDPVSLARRAEKLGAGEILLTSIERDGSMEGYDMKLLHEVAASVGVPVIIRGGAGSMSDLVGAVRYGKASAVAAGSFFVFQGPHRAVLINPPTYEEFQNALESAD